MEAKKLSLIKSLWILLAMGCSNVFAQQDPLYSQYMFNMLAINPAYAGMYDHFNASLISRFQWGQLEGSPRTNTLTANTSLMKGKVGLGAIILSDRLGVNQNTEAHVAYSYKVSTPYYSLTLGLQTGFVNYRYDYSELNLKYVDDPYFVPVLENATRINFGAGAAFKKDKMFIGLSIPRILNNSYDDGVSKSTRYQRHYYLTGAYLFDVRRGMQFKPMVLLKAVPNAPVSVDLHGSLLFNNKVWAGMYTRNFNSFGVMFQYELLLAYKFGYSFEIPGRNFIANNLVTHEFMLSIDLPLLSHHIVDLRHF